MANRYRGEIDAVIGGERRVLVLTLGALAELESAFGASDLVDLAERFGRGRMSARDIIRIIGAGLRGAGERISDAEAAAQAAFQARAIRHGYDPLLVDGASQREFDRAMQEAVGASFTTDGIQYGGVTAYDNRWFSRPKVLVPPNIKASAFRDVILAIRDDDLAGLPTPPQSADGKAYTARDFKAATPVATRGGYRFALGDPSSDDPKFIRGADGRPFVLDLDALAPILRARAPHAFLGGG